MTVLRVVPVIRVNDLGVARAAYVDVDAAYARAVKGGLEIVHDLVDEAWGVRRFFFRDASGSVINVLAHR